MEIIDSARLAPYGANLQPLKFAVIEKEEHRKRIYPMIKYAGYLTDWNPEFDERRSPTDYILVFIYGDYRTYNLNPVKRVRGSDIYIVRI